jgi:hypothetical protein
MPCPTRTRLLAVVSESGLAKLLFGGGDRRESAVEQRRGQTSEPYDCLDNLRQLVFGCQLALTELIVRLVSTGLQLRYQDCSY